MNIPNWPGWHLLGQFPEGDPDGVGSWLLHHNGEAMLLEVPPGLTVTRVRQGLEQLGVRLKYVTASHMHYDHLAPEVWKRLLLAFPDVRFIHPVNTVVSRLKLDVGGELLWLVRAPKHSTHDQVTVFRGVAMLGDIELGQLESVNNEVDDGVKYRSMGRLADFQIITGYRIHSTVSAHLNDVRTNVNWPELFRCHDVVIS